MDKPANATMCGLCSALKEGEQERHALKVERDALIKERDALKELAVKMYDSCSTVEETVKKAQLEAKRNIYGL